MKTLNKRSIRVVGAICCMICMMFMLCAAPQHIYADNQAEIVAVSSSAEKGGTAKVTLNMANNPGMWGLKFKVGYNHDVLTLKSATVGDVFKKSEVTLPPEPYNQEMFVFYATGSELDNITKNGSLIVLEFQVGANATVADYDITLELTQCINVDGDDVAVKMTNGKVSVVDCLHSQKEWKVTKYAGCETKGSETETCKKCGKTFGTRETKATGHKNLTVKNAVAATETAEGYTGDTYCNDCNKLVKKGTVIAKLEKPEPEETETETETESETETETESETETEPDTEIGTGDKEPDSPIGGVIALLVITALLVALVAVYGMYIKGGKLPVIDDLISKINFNNRGKSNKRRR